MNLAGSRAASAIVFTYYSLILFTCIIFSNLYSFGAAFKRIIMNFTQSMTSGIELRERVHCAQSKALSDPMND